MSDKMLQDEANKIANGETEKDEFFGFVTHEPSHIKVNLVCTQNGQPENKVYFAPAQIVSVYRARRVAVPRRSVLTNEKDTYTITDGVITGHKFSEESSLRTIVEIITSPIRALLPSTNTTHTTSVQTGGGKPDQTTNTTTVVITPPK